MLGSIYLSLLGIGGAVAAADVVGNNTNVVEKEHTIAVQSSTISQREEIISQLKAACKMVRKF